jgi:DEAD/DEAH box helicase/MrfA Zn-binding domain/Helicase conserved C-terminal domain
MDLIQLASEIEERYRRYLRTTFYFKDPELRASFEEALRSDPLSKGPFPESAPVLGTGLTARALFTDLLGFEPDGAFLDSIDADRPLYRHQEAAIRSVFVDQNVVVATGTGSGKTESFLYPILLHLYQEFKAGTLGPGVRALVLYPMNALANDQRDRLGDICQRLAVNASAFRFSFGEFIGETPDDESDSYRHARDQMESRKAGELVLRSEMRNTPPHILLTNYSMLEYLLLRPYDSPLFDDGRARWWRLLVLDEAHQYRGARGIEMAMLLRRLKQRLREGGRKQPFRCIATSATLAGGQEDKPAVAKFASDLFGEEFESGSVILAEQERQADGEATRYHLFLRSLEGAFLSLYPAKKVLLSRRAGIPGTAFFEVALCRECGQHYLVGRIANDRLMEAIRDPSRNDAGATFFLPLENKPPDDEEAGDQDVRIYHLCVRCGEIRRSGTPLQCGHDVRALLQKQKASEEREDQIPRCAVCDYQAPDPVREVVHGTDGPHAVIATTLYQNLPEGRKKILAFADGRQEAAFFAWYLQRSYEDILVRNLLLKVAQRQSPDSAEGSSLRDLSAGLRELFRQAKIFPPATTDLELRRKAWLALYREFLTDEPRISLEGVGLVRWSVTWPDWFQTPKVLMDPPWSLSEREAQDTLLILLNSLRADHAVELRGDSATALNWSDLGLQAAQMSFCGAEPNGQTYVRSWYGPHGKRVQFLATLITRMSPALSGKARDIAVDAARAIWETFQECDRQARADDRLLMRVGDARRLNPDWWRLLFVGKNEPIYRCDTCGRIGSASVRGLCSRQSLKSRCPGTLRETRRSELEPNHYRLLYETVLPGALRAEEHTAQLDKDTAQEFQREFQQNKINVLSCSTTFELGVDLGDLDTVFLRNVPPEPFNYAQRVGRAGRRKGHPGFAITYCKRGPHDLYHFSDPNRILKGKIRAPIVALRNERIAARHIMAVALSFFFRSYHERFRTVQDLFKDIDSPSGVADLKVFLLGKRAQIERTIDRVLPREMAERLGLMDGSWIDRITGENSSFARAEAEVASDFRIVKDIEERASALRTPEGHRTAVWASERKNAISREQTLSFLSRKAVIPKYGFPVDVVELDTQRTQQGGVALQRDLSVAISEFAPTSRLIANKKEWTSCGLKKVAEKTWPIWNYKLCRTHNVFLRWKEGEPEPPSQCGDRLQKLKFVIPQFGFVAERRPKDPKRRPVKVFSTRPYFAGSDKEPEVISMPATVAIVSVTRASPGRMVVLCEGRKGKGFYICGSCGAGLPARKSAHETPQGQKNCNGKLECISMGHEFVTDVVQLRFLYPIVQDGGVVDSTGFAFSLAYALMEGAAEVLEVPSTDLSATVAYGAQQAIPPIVLYDNVPGGAGLVARLENQNDMKKCLEIALSRVDGKCGCDEDTSCYGCLRSYRNQFAHDSLRRGPVKHYLDSILSNWG